MNFSTMADSPTQPVNLPSVLWPLALLVGVVIYFGFPFTGGERLDLWFQSFFWQGQAWVLPHDTCWGDALAYKGPKALIIIFAVYLIFIVVLPRFSPSWLNRRRALYVLACLALVPIISTQLRAISHMATPLELKMYGGAYDHLLLFQTKPAGYPCHAFPAGHASGGFALISLYWAWADRSYRRVGLAIGLFFGGVMGLYQIARGEHFLSHTLTTALIAWLVSACLARLIEPTRAA
jgi:membrane-associated PAP2 superfamily phosphatase